MCGAGRFLPAYTMAPDAGKITLLRCVVREDLSMGMVDNLVADLRRIVENLDKLFVFTDKEVSMVPVSFPQLARSQALAICGMIFHMILRSNWP